MLAYRIISNSLTTRAIQYVPLQPLSISCVHKCLLMLAYGEDGDLRDILESERSPTVNRTHQHVCK